MGYDEEQKAQWSNKKHWSNTIGASSKWNMTSTAERMAIALANHYLRGWVDNKQLVSFVSFRFVSFVSWCPAPCCPFCAGCFLYPRSDWGKPEYLFWPSTTQECHCSEIRSIFDFRIHHNEFSPFQPSVSILFWACYIVAIYHLVMQPVTHILLIFLYYGRIIFRRI